MTCLRWRFNLRHHWAPLWVVFLCWCVQCDSGRPMHQRALAAACGEEGDKVAEQEKPDEWGA